MRLTAFAFSLLAAPLLAQAAPAPGEGAPANARVFFIGVKDGDVVPTKLRVQFGLEKMKVRPAGEDIFDRNSGHHHLLIDSGPIPRGQMIMLDAKNIHYGKGQTEDEIKLEPGPHTLTLQFADGAHTSYGPSLSATIHVLADVNAK
ncbi:DUF4399 domain-containing protein [Chitinimonas sp.]|uniref:DUF4399 domain-containing protein n=1 Tax=Chitinimonas sp. TaxID=1934313 RepID=UPI0035B11776